MGVNSLPKTLTRQCRGCDLNPGPTAPESSTLTTRLPSHPTITNCVLNIPNLTHNPNQEADVGDSDLRGGGECPEKASDQSAAATTVLSVQLLRSNGRQRQRQRHRSC